MKLLEGPTLNPEYNLLLVKWSIVSGEICKPECEECGCDLTGKEVHETLCTWLCSSCYRFADENPEPYDDYREDFHSDI